MNESWKNIVSVNNFEKNSIKSFDMGKYLLIIGNNAADIFKYYNVEKMHGLNLNDAIEEEINKTVGNGVYIYGLTNYNPEDKGMVGLKVCTKFELENE